MKRVSYREYLVWMERFQGEWNNPSRSDYYLMQIAATQIKMKGEKLDRLKIPFKFEGRPSTSKMSVETATALAKARWHARLGVSEDGGG